MSIRVLCCLALLMGMMNGVQAAGDRGLGRGGRWWHGLGEKFDADGDGKLSEQEWTAAKEAYLEKMNKVRGPNGEDIDFERLAKAFKKGRDAVENGKLPPRLEDFKRRDGGDQGQKEKKAEPAKKEVPARPDPAPREEEKETNADPLVRMLDKLDAKGAQDGDKSASNSKLPKKEADRAMEEDEDEVPGRWAQPAQVPSMLSDDDLASGDLEIFPRAD